MERLSVRERERIAELLAEGAPFWRLRQEIPRSRHAINRAVRSILRPPPVEPSRSRLHVAATEREEISRGSRRVNRCVRSRGGWDGRRRRCRARSRATAVAVAIGPAVRTGPHWRGCGDRRSPSWRAVLGCGPWSRRSSSCVGLRRRSRVGCRLNIPTTRRCGCRTRPSTCRCSCKPAARSAGSSPAISDISTAVAGPAANPCVTGKVTSRPWSTSATGPPKPTTAQCRGTGKATCSTGTVRCRRDPRRATQPLRHARRPARLSLRRCRRRRARSQDRRVTRTMSTVPHLGSRTRDGTPRRLHHRQRCTRLLLRPS